MASLMENLIDVLNRQYEEYVRLVELSEKKTPVIVQGNLEALQEMTDAEQLSVNRISNLDREREEIMKDIANVMNQDADTLRITDLITMLSKRPNEQKQLIEIKDKLKEIAQKMKRVNDKNGMLLQNSLEMVNFDLNLIQSLRQAPETANYTKGAYNSGSMMGTSSGSFDTKQ
ncbi:MAG: flagellar protein FlgN [Lachnospiraceae bacterium]|nr:flagellar protein FlgN [Lachnospiraceae bacterium]